MGYDLHITRAQEIWTENENCPITMEEWSAVAHADPSLFVDGEISFKTTGAQPLYGWRLDGVPQETCFYVFAGNVDCKDPSEITIKKMLELAAILNARVQGDDGEYYSREPQSPTPGPAVPTAWERLRAWWAGSR